VVQAACTGQLPEGKILTFDRILEVAEEAAKGKGYVAYSDYDPDLLAEVLNGSRAPSALGWRLQSIRDALMQKRWKPIGRPVRFYPP
jgi:hypothetical protein